MIRICSVPLVVVFLTLAVLGQETETDWRLHVIPLKERSFDFRTVAKGATPEHRFILRNPLTEPMIIGRITASCDCAKLRYDTEKKILKTYEEFIITVQYRGDLFEGQKNAIITVAIEKPITEIIQLNIRGDIRTDLKISPNVVDFGNVELGRELTKPLTVTYRGPNTQWRLVEAKCDNQFIHSEITRDHARGGIGANTFSVKVTLDQSAPNGSISARLVLISNDTAARREIPIPIRATVGTVIWVTPPALSLGVLPPGKESSNKQALLIGTKPFRITNIECDNPAVEIMTKIDPDAPANMRHPIVLMYRNPVDGEGSPDENGEMRAEIRTTTDVPGLVSKFYVTASILKD